MVKAEAIKTRSWNVAIYLTLFSIAGIGLAASFLLDYINHFSSIRDIAKEGLEFIVLTTTLSLCRSFPLPTRKGQGADISIILLYAAIVLKGLDFTILTIVVSAFFTFDKRDDSNVGHIWNTHISKTLFNNSNYIIAVSIGWLIFTSLGGRVGTLDLPGLLVPSILFLIVTLLVNSVNMFTILKLSAGIPFIPSFVRGVVSTLPTLFAVAPIGYFIAVIFIMPDGPYMTLLFFIPLLFARYAFKLYLDSKEQYLRTISTLTTAIEAKDEYTEGHSKRVAQFAVEIAQAMEIRSSRIEHIKVAAVLHDIGKIGIYDEILRKPSKLNDDEWSKIVQHPSIGIKILEEVSMPELVKEIIHYHHVRYDRSGYPKIEKERQLPLEVHIISLADAFDAMTSDRPYRKALTEDMALDIIAKERGTQFHPDVVDMFIKMKKRK